MNIEATHRENVDTRMRRIVFSGREPQFLEEGTFVYVAPRKPTSSPERSQIPRVPGDCRIVFAQDLQPSFPARHSLTGA